MSKLVKIGTLKSTTFLAPLGVKIIAALQDGLNNLMRDELALLQRLVLRVLVFGVFQFQG